MTADDIITEVRKQAYRLKARNHSLNPKNFKVYLGMDEVSTLKTHVEFLYENTTNNNDMYGMRILGMPIFEVYTKEPHIKVTD